MWKRKLKIGCAKIRYLGYQQIGQQKLNMYDMHSEWHTAVIKKCQVCLWCQIAIIIHGNTVFVSVHWSLIICCAFHCNKQGLLYMLVGNMLK